MLVYSKRYQPCQKAVYGFALKLYIKYRAEVQ